MAQEEKKRIFNFDSKDFKALDDGNFQFEGMFSDESIDFVNDIVLASAVKGSFEEFGDPAFLWNHDQSQPIGAIQDFFQDGDKSFIRSVMPKDLKTNTDVLAPMIRVGGVKGLSIGYFVLESKRENRGGILVRIITKIHIFEISIVTIPCNQETHISSFKNKENEMEKPDFKEMAEKGMSVSNLISRRIWEFAEKGFEREDIYKLISEKSGLTPRDVRSIVWNEVDTPDDEALKGISEALGIPIGTLMNAAELDRIERKSIGLKELKTISEVEKYLKENGLSNTEAKTIISKVGEFKSVRDDGSGDSPDAGRDDQDKENEEDKAMMNALGELKKLTDSITKPEPEKGETK